MADLAQRSAHSRRTFLARATGGAATLAMPGLPGIARARTPGVLTVGLTAYPPNLRPFENVGASAGAVKINHMRGLLSYGEGGVLRPELAESWERPDPTTLVFKLRGNAKFHNGDPVTAADVKHTFDLVTAERSTAYLRTELAIVDRIEMPDPLTARIILKRPSATFPFLLATYHLPIISQKSNAQEAIGCGPYQISRIERGVRIEMTASPNFYRQGLPRTRRLNFVAYVDDNLRVAALEAGDVDLIEYVPWPNMAAIERNTNLAMESTDGAYMHVIFNFRQGPFTDARLRQAVAYAIDRQAVVQAAFQGRGAVLESIAIPRTSPFHDPQRAGFWRRDLDRARALLREAGQPNGFNCTLLSSAQFNMHKDTAEVVQQSVRAIGINAELHMPEWSQRIQLGNRGQYDFAVMGSAGDFNDPDSLSQQIAPNLPASYGRSFGYANARMGELLQAGRTEIDPEKRKPIYAEIERLAQQDAVQVGVAWRSQAYAYYRYVRGFVLQPGFITFLSPYSYENIAVD
jgi:peptide/nickel transport system substrate-binding protein